MSKPVQIATLGDASILDLPKVGFLSSRKVPPAAVIRCYDWATEVRDKGVCVMGGFQSPLERDVLAVPFSQYLGFVFYDNGETNEFRVFGADNLEEDDTGLTFDDTEPGTGGDWTRINSSADRAKFHFFKIVIE